MTFSWDLQEESKLAHRRPFQDQTRFPSQSWPGQAARGCSFVSGLFSPASRTQTLQAGHLQRENSITKSRGYSEPNPRETRRSQEDARQHGRRRSAFVVVGGEEEPPQTPHHLTPLEASQTCVFMQTPPPQPGTRGHRLHLKTTRLQTAWQRLSRVLQCSSI